MQQLPLPHPDSLKIHASCCKVANLSGASRYIQTYLMELESSCSLRQDGSSAETLRFALQELVAS
jgi:hypothetical protein